MAPDVATARSRAYAAASLAMHDQGVDLAPDALTVRCRPAPAACLQPGSSVEVRIDTDVELPLVPRVFGGSTAAVAVHVSHVEPYGVFREAQP